MGRRITHIWGDAGADTLHEQPGCLTARPVKPAAPLTVFAEHLKSPLAMALRLLPVAKPAPAFPPEDGNRLLLMEPAVPQRPGQPKPWGGSASLHPAPSRPPTSHDLSGHQQLTLLGADFEEDEALVVLEEDWTPWAINWACWLLTRSLPSHPVPGPSIGRAPLQAPFAATSKTRVASPWEAWPRANRVTKRGWKLAAGNMADHWGPAMSAGDHLHNCACYGLWPDSETLAGRGEHLLHFSFLSQLETNTASPFLHSVYPWCTHGNPELEGISRNISSSRIVLLHPLKMLIKSLCNSHQRRRAHHLPGVAGWQEELLFPQANPRWSWHHARTLKHLTVYTHQDGPRPSRDSVIWSVLGLWA